MNIFVLDSDPILASNLLDKHIVKMPLETAQILCTVAHHKGFIVPYKPTHINHPSVKWTAKSVNNWAWLCEHGLGICKNYTISYNKIHKCQNIIQNLMDKTQEIWKTIGDSKSHTDFVLCMPDKYKGLNPIEAYRNYYREDKAYIAKWTNREIPIWWKNNMEIIND